MPGAKIERGRILARESEGYIIASIDRPGIQSGPIQPITDESYTVGQTVYFFLFPDGTGFVLSGLSGGGAGGKTLRVTVEDERLIFRYTTDEDNI